MKEDLEAFFQAVSEELPSGTDLEYDPDFARMEKASHGTPDQEMGSTHIEAQPPDWEVVLEAARNLLARTKDLRVATYYAQAKLALDGLSGFRDGLQVIAVFVDKFWDAVYPQLDADDDNDPTIRINALLSLNSIGGVIRQLRDTPILASRSVGRFSLTDVLIARGELPVPEAMEQPPTIKKLDAAVQSCDVNELAKSHEAVDQSLKYTLAIEKGFSDRLAFGQGPNIEHLTKELKNISRFQKIWLEQLRSAESEETNGSASAVSSDSTQSSSSTSQPELGGVPKAGNFAIGRREDAILGLEKIISWFERYEPSSPLPMLLRRAKRLSNLSFLEILRDISPDGLNQAVMIGGNEALDVGLARASQLSGDSTEQSTISPKPVVPADDKY